MDFQEIQSRVEALVKLGGWSNAVPGPDYAYLANEGLRLLTRQTQHNVETKTITTAAQQEVYSLVDSADTRDWIAFFDDALYNTNTWLPQRTRHWLRTLDRLWRQTAASTPAYWYWSGPQEIGLYPKPSASGTTITLNGPRHEPRMSAVDDKPRIEETFHEGICLFGAWHWGKLFSRGEERDVAKEYLMEAQDYVKEYKSQMASQEAGSVVRTVARPPQEYLGMGSRYIPVWP